MTCARFAACLPLILEHEGGWSDNPKDPGGATMKGVTLASYSDWLHRTATKAELKKISPDTLAAIYEARYWKAAACDLLPPGLDYLVFDFAVNSGPARAKRFLQEAVVVRADGDIGLVTLGVIDDMGAAAVIQRLSQLRNRFYRSLDAFPTFGKGWLRRLQEVTQHALETAKEAAG